MVQFLLKTNDTELFYAVKLYAFKHGDSASGLILALTYEFMQLVDSDFKALMIKRAADFELSQKEFKENAYRAGAATLKKLKRAVPEKRL